jgi:prepilin-type N-terminal cleavage/methylation domain-containing protein
MHGRLSKRRPSAGFTLLELIIVMSILGILVALGIPNFKSLFIRTTEESLRSHLSNTILIAASRASHQREAKEVVFDLDKGTYHVQNRAQRDGYDRDPRSEVRGRLPRGYVFKGIYFPRGTTTEEHGEVVVEVRPDGTTEDMELDLAELDADDQEVKYLRMLVTGSTGRSTWKSIEVLVSVLIMSIALAVLLDSIRTSIDSNVITQEMTRAITLAQQKTWEMETTFLWKTEEAQYKDEGQFKENPTYRFKVDARPDLDRSEVVVIVTVSWLHKRIEKSYNLVSVVPLERNRADFKSGK